MFTKGTKCKHHDRCAITEIKNYWGKNSGVQTKDKNKLRIREIGEEHFAMGLEKDWANPNTVWEMMDAAFNYAAVEHMTRQYSYAALSMIRAIHDCRFFIGVAASPKQQRVLVENYFNEMLKKNQHRGREGKHPLTFRECKEVSKEVCAAAQVG